MTSTHPMMERQFAEDRLAAAYFSPDPRPSLMRLDVGAPGLRLP